MRGLLRCWGLISLSWAAAAGATTPCADILPGPARAIAGVGRGITSGDLVRIRDIGRSGDPATDPSALAISPDGSQVAFQLRRADPVSNSYCLATVVIAIRPQAPSRIIDRGGELIRGVFNNNGLVDFPSGVPALITPRWSPDGAWVAFRKKTTGGVVQVWRARADGTTSEQITHSNVDIDDFRWSPDGTGIVYSSRPGSLRVTAELAREARGGYQYDDRFSPMAANYPFPKGPITREFFVTSARSGITAEATAVQRTVLEPSAIPANDANVSMQVEGPGGARAWTVSSASIDPRAPIRMYAKAEDGRTTLCEADVCRSEIVGLWWGRDAQSLLYLRREGPVRGALGLYRWLPGSSPSRLAVVEGLLTGCQQAAAGLICAQENSTAPRRIVLLDSGSGQLRILFDPNPEFHGIRLGSVQRLQWANNYGIEAFGDLVLPPHHQPGEKHPLIVVQYQSRGFLRGGTGDEYPIQLFAEHGFAVLSFNRPRDFGEVPEASDVLDIERRNLTNWNDRRSVLNSLEKGVQRALATGTIDAARIGITGFSDGAATVQFALINSKLFSAAALSSCCLGPNGTVVGGEGVARIFQSIGFPSIIEPAADFWNPISLSANATTISAPILMQLSDDEYQLALHDYESLRATGKSIEMFVFPDERHVKWQPAHRLAIYERSLAFFIARLQTSHVPAPASGRAR